MPKNIPNTSNPFLIFGDPPIKVRLKRAVHSRRLSLRVSRLDGRVTLSLPTRTAEHDILHFLTQHETWLRTQLTALPLYEIIQPGTALPVEGEMLTLCPPQHDTQQRLRGVIREPGVLRVGGNTAQYAPKVKAFLKVLARERLAQACDYYAQKLEKSYQTISLRDPRSRWGSCTSRGGLMFSWRLIMAPPQVLGYVAAHEVAHLAHMDHSPAFWAAVSRLYPNWKEQRHWLHHNGHDLHRYRFSNQDME